MNKYIKQTINYEATSYIQPLPTRSSITQDLLDYILNKAKDLKIVSYNAVDKRVGYVYTTPDTPIPFYFENVGTDDAVINVFKCASNAITVSLEISTDNTNWETWGSTSTTALSKTIGAGKRLYIRNAEDVGYFSNNSSNYNKFSSTGANIIVGGNIMSLGYKNFENEYTIEQSYAYTNLFKDMLKLVDASSLVLPATTLADYCYRNMFSACKSLTTAPVLSATTLAVRCYQNMFSACTSLTTAPELPATTLANGCYEYMFSGCTSLTTAPELPATELANGCYSYMFINCTSLTKAPELPATTLINNCYQLMFQGCTSLTTAPELPATTLANMCYMSMFSGCTSLTTVQTKLPATTLATSCYSNMFFNCTSLTTAPELPATTLESSCYAYMFSGCTSLNYVKAMFTNTNNMETNGWLNDVAPTGTFVKNANATWTSAVKIPTGWTVVTATE